LWDRFDKGFEHYTVTGKGGYTMTLPVHQNLRDHLKGMETPYPYLFPGERGRAHVTPATVWTWVREVGLEAGIEGLRPHQLRHTAGATMNDRTGDLRATSEFLRHRRLETTMIYTRTTEGALVKAMNALDY
jgi:integrase